jgi:hypothetical protein
MRRRVYRSRHKPPVFNSRTIRPTKTDDEVTTKSRYSGKFIL